MIFSFSVSLEIIYRPGVSGIENKEFGWFENGEIFHETCISIETD
jgi:hypothetical protein